MTRTSYIDLLIIGAGPAGMAAAIEASALGLSVTVLSEGPAPGGRIYHAIEDVAANRAAGLTLLGDDYAAGHNLVRELRDSSATLLCDAAAFRLDPDGSVWFTHDDRAHAIRARKVLIATGALERPVPMPGWTLPGVMTAGAAQLLLKGDDIIPSGPVVLAGAGPLLLLAASQLVDAGGDVRAVIETTGIADYLAAAPMLPGALRAPEYLVKGMALRKRLRASGVALIGGARDLAVLGEARATGLQYRRNAALCEIQAETVLLHNGVVPDPQLSRQVGCRQKWHSSQRCWVPERDAWGRTSLTNILVVGDGGGIAGAIAARCSGAIAALGAACDLDVISADDGTQRARPWRRTLAHHQSVRPFLERLFRPCHELLAPQGEATLACRCEEVTVADIREAARLGCPGPNQLKAFTRAGMGPCQGRMCGLTISEIMARERGMIPEDIGYLNIRPPVKPVTLAQLAAMDEPAGG